MVWGVHRCTVVEVAMAVAVAVAVAVAGHGLSPLSTFATYDMRLLASRRSDVCTVRSAQMRGGFFRQVEVEDGGL